jgi:hypothetical protein
MADIVGKEVNYVPRQLGRDRAERQLSAYQGRTQKQLKHQRRQNPPSTNQGFVSSEDTKYTGCSNEPGTSQVRKTETN